MKDQQTKYFDPWLQQIVDECSNEKAGMDSLRLWHDTLESDIQFITGNDKTLFTNEEFQQYVDVLIIVEKLIEKRNQS